METIISTIVEIPMSHLVMALVISTSALMLGRLKLALFINYCFIICSGRLWDVSLFNSASDSRLNLMNFGFMGFWIIIVFLAALCLAFHKE